MENVTIVGAGPGGASAALFLAQNGVSCTLLERAAFPRDKVCGDALSGKVVEVLNKIDKTIVSNFAQRPEQLGCWGVSFVGPNGKELKIPFKLNYNSATQQAPGFISRRWDFDAFLIEQVKKQPLVRLIENAEAVQITPNANGVNIRLKNGEQLNSPLVIGADGAHSIVNKQLGGIKVEPRHYCAGVRAYYEGVEGLDADNFIELIFLKDILPGYLWIFPLPNGMANVGLGMRSDMAAKRKVNLKKLLVDFIEQTPSLRHRFRHARLTQPIVGFGLPLGSKKRRISGERFMLTGDAASLIDPFTGEGIGNALFSGMFAARQAVKCLQTNDFSAPTLLQYDKAVYDRLWDELRLSKIMQELIQYPWLFNLVINKANNSKTLRDAICVMFEDVDLRQQFKNPLFYLKIALGY